MKIKEVMYYARISSDQMVYPEYVLSCLSRVQIYPGSQIDILFMQGVGDYVSLICDTCVGKMTVASNYSFTL